MANITFFYNNYWDNVSNIIELTQHSNFPAENTQTRDFNEPWRSRYGAGSGWGIFIITSSNNKLDFEDSGATTRVATLTQASNYTAETLASHIETQMEAVCTDSFTVTYLESGSNANKFKIRNETGNFKLLWNTGANKANSVAGTIGFDDTADDTGAQEYTADEIRIHTDEYLKINLGAAYSMNAFIARGHNIQSGATKNIQGNSSDSWASPPFSQACDRNAKIVGKIYSSAQSYQWWRFLLKDIDNPDTYLNIGYIFLGPSFQPTDNFLSKSRVTMRVDPSIIKQSEGGQKSSIQLSHYDSWQYRFRVKGTAQKAYFDDMFDKVGASKVFFICDNPSNFPGDTYLCQIIPGSWEWQPIYEIANLYELTFQVEEMR